jgi:hypothetical protein
MTDEVFQAWRQSAARVALHPAWPVPIELSVACRRSSSVVLQCVVHAYDASDVLADLPLVPWADLPMMHIAFSQIVPDIDDTPACEGARIQHIRTRVHETVLHELDEFLLVDGHVAASPHKTTRPTFVSTLSNPDEISTWRAAIARISLHPAFRLQVGLGVNKYPGECPTISCTVRTLDPNLEITVRNTADARVNTLHVQQLLALVRHSVQRLLDECLIVDGIPVSRISTLQGH